MSASQAPPSPAPSSEELVAEVARLRGELASLERQLGLLVGFGRPPGEGLVGVPLVERILGEVVEAMMVDVAMIHLVADGQLALAGLRVKNGEPPPAALATLARLPIDKSSLSGIAAAEKRSVVTDRDGWPERTAPLTVDYAACSGASHPLVVQGRLLGTLCVVRRHDRPFSDSEVRLLEACAAHFAAVIDCARMYEEERRRVHELNLLLDVGRVVTASFDLDQILEASAVSTARMVDASHAFIWILDPSTNELAGGATSATEHQDHFRAARLRLDDTSLAGRAVVTRAPVQAVDATTSPMVHQGLLVRYGMKSLLALPLMVRDEPIGTVVIGDSRSARVWLPSEVERATLVVRHVAVAVANARLFDDLRKSYDELARTQQALVRRERFAALGELAAVVAHEVRNPLGVIWNSLVSLRKIVPQSGDAVTLLDILDEESDRLNRMIGDLLDFARPHEPTLSRDSLESIIAGAIESARSAGTSDAVEFCWELPQPLPPVYVDARMLRQAFINLLTNAVQAMPQGGRVVIRAAEEGGGGRGIARVDVIDEGPGMSAEIVEQVFAPFFTTKATGTGLGLAIVKRIVQAHHGEISLETSEGQGTTFTVRLPLAKP